MTATACVLGSVDLLQAIGRAGLRAAVFTTDSDPMRWSRHADELLDGPADFCDQAAFADALCEWAGRCSTRSPTATCCCCSPTAGS